MTILLALAAALLALAGGLLLWRRRRSTPLRIPILPSPEIRRSNGGLSNSTSPYVLHLHLPGRHEPARLPVHRALRTSPGATVRERYWVDLLGVRVEAPSLPALREATQSLYLRLLEAGPLPEYWLGNHRVWVPVFFRDGGYTARVYDGPEFAAPRLSVIRDRLEAYLRAPVFAVLRLSRRDLSLHRPCGTFEGPGVWIPVWREGGGFVLPAGEADGIGEAEDLLTLHRHTAEALVRAGRLSTPADLALRCTEPLPGEATPHVLSVPLGPRQKVRLPVLRMEAVLGCQVDGLLVLADDLWTLREAAGKILERAGRVRREEVRLERTDSVEREEAFTWSGSGSF
jgi:hypothetical protein